MTDDAPVVARGLVKRYGDITAVAGVDLTVEAGDVFGYLGPNGAGKTTSLRMLLGLIRPSAGTASLFGRDPLQLGARALDGVAGFVEGPRFYPYLSGRRNLRLLADYDEPRSASLIDEVLELVDLRDRAKDRVGGYSHGMRQRLGIAAALLRRPQLLLLDEPATGLDPAGMRDMRDLIRRLAGEGLTILLSSHLLYEVEELCNRVAIIRKGAIVYEGKLAELMATAATTYRLRTRDPERARTICLNQRGLEQVVATGDELSFTADEDSVAALSLALGQARVPIVQLVAETATLEELFLGLTGGDTSDRDSQAEPVLFLLDIGNWSVPGMTLLSHLIDQLPETPVLVLGDADSDDFGEVVDRGAAGWLTSEASVGEVIDAVDRLLEGHLVVPSSELTTMIEQMREPTPTANEPKLTTRERDVLRAMTVGMSAQAIADDLGIRVSTARKHIQNILNKLGLHSQLQAAAYAARHGISDR